MAMNAGSGQVQAAINVTPMIDGLLVLLIVFMAIAPTRSSGLDAIFSPCLRGGDRRVLFVKAAAALDFGVVAEAIDIAHGVNIDHVALMPR